MVFLVVFWRWLFEKLIIYFEGLFIYIVSDHYFCVYTCVATPRTRSFEYISSRLGKNMRPLKKAPTFCSFYRRLVTSITHDLFLSSRFPYSAPKACGRWRMDPVAMTTLWVLTVQTDSTAAVSSCVFNNSCPCWTIPRPATCSCSAGKIHIHIRWWHNISALEQGTVPTWW